VIGLGTRWAFGSEPPARLSAAFAAAIRDVEAGISGARAQPPAGSWTLTWLEGRPVAESDVETAAGVAVVTEDPVSGAPGVTFQP
jgi:hypothetical protein